MDHFKNIYAHKAAEYHQMISVEDADGNLLSALEQAMPLKGKSILDLGTGTGRIPLLLNHVGGKIVGLDLNHAMLVEQAVQKEQVDGNWSLVEGDMHYLPFPSGWVDVVIAGWAIGHQIGWFPKEWRIHVEKILNEMQRVVKPGGAVIIMETMSTGSLTPAPPNQDLADYYAFLEKNWMFSRKVIATDYTFKSVSEAAGAVEFFFGAEMTDLINKNGWARLPEWTGVWSKIV